MPGFKIWFYDNCITTKLSPIFIYEMHVSFEIKELRKLFFAALTKLSSTLIICRNGTFMHKKMSRSRSRFLTKY